MVVARLRVDFQPRSIQSILLFRLQRSTGASSAPARPPPLPRAALRTAHRPSILQVTRQLVDEGGAASRLQTYFCQGETHGGDFQCTAPKSLQRSEPCSVHAEPVFPGTSIVRGRKIPRDARPFFSLSLFLSREFKS